MSLYLAQVFEDLIRRELAWLREPPTCFRGPTVDSDNRGRCVCYQNHYVELKLCIEHHTTSIDFSIRAASRGDDAWLIGWFPTLHGHWFASTIDQPVRAIGSALRASRDTLLMGDEHALKECAELQRVWNLQFTAEEWDGELRLPWPPSQMPNAQSLGDRLTAPDPPNA